MLPSKSSSSAAQTPPTKLAGIEVTQAVNGIVLPILMGQRRLPQNLIWYGDFTAIPHTQQTGSGGGGKGLGGGGGSSQTTTTYTYTAATMGALCSGPAAGIVNVWDTKGHFQQTSVTESFTIPPGGGTYTVVNHGLFKLDQGVSFAQTYSQTVNDFGSAGSTTLSGTQQVPMTIGLGSQQYTVNTTTGQYTFHASDAGKAVQITYSYNLLAINNTETATIPASGPFQILVQDSADFLQNTSVLFYPAETPLTLVGSSPATGQYTVSAGLYTFASADANKQVQINYITNTSNQNSDAQTALNLTLLNGARGQTVWSYLTSRHPEAAIGYTETAVVASSAMDLGENGELPNYAFEVAGPYQFGAGIVDCDPADCIGALLSDTFFGCGFPTTSFGDWTGASNFWVANSFFISPLLNSQDKVASTIGQILEAGMTAAFWSEGQLKLVPYGDTSAVGNGQTFIPNTQPVVDFTSDDFLEDVKVTRTPWQDANNKIQVTWSNRLNGYNNETTTEQDDAARLRYGNRDEDPQQWDFITTLQAAQCAANLRLKRSVNIRASYTFRVKHNYSFLEPMDLVTITVSELGWNKLPVRIQQIVDNPDNTGLEITAEEFPWGTAQPTLYQKQLGTGFKPNAGQADPGNTTAVIFEAPNRLAMQQGNVLYGFVTGASPDWGGCQPFISFDGTTYRPYGNPIMAPARLGTLNTSLAAGTSDPDTNNFKVTMTNANDVLNSFSTTDFNQGVSMCVLFDSTDNNPFELFAYKNATIVGANQFQLDTFHRGQFGTTNAAHSSGETFARLDDASFQFQYDPSYYGKTVSFKFCSFNTLGGRSQPLSQAGIFSLTLNGLGPGAIDLNTGLYRPGLGSIPPSWTGVITWTSAVPGTSVVLSWNITINRGTMPNPSQPSTTLTSQSYVGSQTITGLTASTNYWVYPYLDDSQAGSPLLFVNNSQVSGATGTPAIAYTAVTANATYFSGRNDHLPVNNGPLQITTAPSSGSGIGGNGTGIGGSCPRGDMVVEHRTKGVVRIDQVVSGDHILGRDGWVTVLDVIHYWTWDWTNVFTECGEDAVVTPYHTWPTPLGDARTPFITDLFMREGRLTQVSDLHREHRGDLCVGLVVDGDHCYYIGRNTPRLLTHNAGTLARS